MFVKSFQVTTVHRRQLPGVVPGNALIVFPKGGAPCARCFPSLWLQKIMVAALQLPRVSQ